MVFGSSFTYDGINSDSYNVIMCSIDSFGLDDIDTGLSTEIISDSTSSIERFEYSAKYNSVITFEMTLCNKDFTSLTKNQIRNITKWLTGRKKAAWLSLKNENYDDVNYKCRVISATKKKVGDTVLGLLLKWECSSPYAYTEEYVYNFSINGSNQEVIIYNDTDDTENYLYPNIIIKSKSNMEVFSIYNVSDNNRLTKLKNIVYNEVIQMDNQNGIISTNIHDKKLLPLFEGRKWFRLVEGENILKITGNCDLSISLRFPRKVGDF